MRNLYIGAIVQPYNLLDNCQVAGQHPWVCLIAFNEYPSRGDGPSRVVTLLLLLKVLLNDPTCHLPRVRLGNGK